MEPGNAARSPDWIQLLFLHVQMGQVQAGPQEQFSHLVMVFLLFENAVERHLLLETHDRPAHYTSLAYIW